MSAVLLQDDVVGLKRKPIHRRIHTTCSEKASSYFIIIGLQEYNAGFWLVVDLYVVVIVP